MSTSDLDSYSSTTSVFGIRARIEEQKRKKLDHRGKVLVTHVFHTVCQNTIVNTDVHKYSVRNCIICIFSVGLIVF